MRQVCVSWCATPRNATTFRNASQSDVRVIDRAERDRVSTRAIRSVVEIVPLRGTRQSRPVSTGGRTHRRRRQRRLSSPWTTSANPCWRRKPEVSRVRTARWSPIPRATPCSQHRSSQRPDPMCVLRPNAPRGLGVRRTPGNQARVERAGCSPALSPTSPLVPWSGAVHSATPRARQHTSPPPLPKSHAQVSAAHHQAPWLPVRTRRHPAPVRPPPGTR